jgi:steroid delta-isomerase-like uncharacterized protein
LSSRPDRGYARAGRWVADEREETDVADDNTAVVRALFDAFNEGDMARAAATVTDDFELVDLAAGQTFHGRDGCRQWLETFKMALPDARTEVVNLVGDGDRVASEHIGRGTQTGPFVTPAGAIPPTGRQIELRIGEFYELREGKIAKLHAYYDGATMLRQLGLLPPAGSGAERVMTTVMATAVKARQALTRS